MFRTYPLILQENHYYAYGSAIPKLSTANGRERYTYNGKELVEDFNINLHDYGARQYDPLTARWNGVDALAEKFHSSGSYNYVLGNPIGNIDPDGRSTHTDMAGNVMAVFDDGDLGVYRHDIQSGTHIDGARAYIANKRADTRTTSGGGERMGQSVHIFSFTKFDELEKGNIVPTGKIDFSSHWALENVQSVMADMQGKSLIYYALNAGSREKYDIKSVAGEQFGDIYYGSILYNDGKQNIYASARDAGNFAAGEVQQNSLMPNYLISVGFGAFNYADNNKPKGALYALEKFILGINPDPFSFGPYSPLKPPYYGEDIGTGNAIKAGRDYYKAHPYTYNLNY